MTQCSVIYPDGRRCTQPVAYHQMCSRHVQRFRKHGDPLAGGRERDVGASKRALDEFWRWVQQPNDDRCRWWKFDHSEKGYPWIRIDGRWVYVHRWACEIWNGPCPDGMEASHLCINGRKLPSDRLGACWNGEHIIWESHADNLRRKVQHGTANRGERAANARLTADDVRELRRLYATGNYTLIDLATPLGISEGHAHNIVTGKRWGWLA